MVTLRSRLTHWGRVRHICVSKLTIIGSDKGLSPGRHQAVIWTNAGILLIGPLGPNFSEILIKIYIFSFKKMHLKTLSGKWRPFCLGINVITLTNWEDLHLLGAYQRCSTWSWSCDPLYIASSSVGPPPSPVLAQVAPTVPPTDWEHQSHPL